MEYLDTSVLTSYYCPEDRSAAVQRAVAGVDAPTISPLVEMEFYGVVARKLRRGDMTRRQVHDVLAQFQAHLGQPFYRAVAIAAAEYDLARQWLLSLSSPLRAVDALHLAAAAANDLRLLTADQTLADCARRFGVRCRLIA